MQYLLNFLCAHIVADLSAIRTKTLGPMKELSNRLATYQRISGLNDAMFHENRKQKENSVFGRELQELPDNTFEWKNGAYLTFTSDQITVV